MVHESIAVAVILLILSGCSTRVAAFESAETQTYETCNAFAQGFAFINQQDYENAQKRFEYGLKSAKAFHETLPSEPNSKILLDAANAISEISPDSLGETQPRSVQDTVEAMSAICDGLPSPK